MPAFQDLSGQIFGRLMAVERAPSLDRQTRWECLCECGKTPVVLATLLTQGKTKSCGCIRSERAAARNAIQRRPYGKDRTGMRFGLLVAVERDPIGDCRWICRCDCGGVTSVRSNNLDGDRVRSCGCRRKTSGDPVDMVGARYGRLIGLERSGANEAGEALWLFLCNCGNKVVLPGKRVRSGGTKSCGCQKRESARLTNRKHGMAHTLAYKRWESIKQRTTNPKNPSYKNYGARGIKMCAEWMGSFDAFYAYVGECPGQEWSLDRLDNDGNYEAGNVAWSTRSQQMRNRRPIKRATRAEVDAADAQVARLGQSNAVLTEEVERLEAEIARLKGDGAQG